MAEYIEREAISEGIRKYYYKNPPNSSYEEGFDRGLDRAQRAILDAPAADVAPVVHGRWEYYDTYIDGITIFRCTCCGDFQSGRDGWGWKKNYCPKCGAKMDLEG